MARITMVRNFLAAGLAVGFIVCYSEEGGHKVAHFSNRFEPHRVLLTRTDA